MAFLPADKQKMHYKEVKTLYRKAPEADKAKKYLEHLCNIIYPANTYVVNVVTEPDHM